MDPTHDGYTVTLDGYAVTTDLARADLDAVAAMLRSSYWAADRPPAVTAAAFRSSASIPFVLLDPAGRTVGCARVVTDRLTFGWVCDVFVHPDHRGRGRGKFLVRAVLAHPDLDRPGVRLTLNTRDAHGLYESFGFARRELMWRHPQGGDGPAGA